ncbi:MAG TPA: N-formylglutamate amidohydrolase [Polyangiaceae bacterium]
MTLLADDEPSPFEVVGEGARSPWVLLCDHAGRALPRAVGSLGLEARELERHIAWDIGAAALARELRQALDGVLILQTYSRLVIDCNRPLSSPTSIAEQSEDTSIPGNRAVPREQAELRARAIFEPYHARIRRELDERASRGIASRLVFVHSFTPTFRGVSRAWHAGVLYLRDTRLALPLLAALRREPGLVVGDNEPYAASALTDYGIVEHAERRGLPYVELEVRQDLLADSNGVRAWAERLARLLEESAVFPE